MKYEYEALAFRGPCIVIYSYNKTQRDALFLKFILVKNSKCFEQQNCPKHVEFFTQINLRILTVELSETCRVLYPNK